MANPNEEAENPFEYTLSPFDPPDKAALTNPTHQDSAPQIQINRTSLLASSNYDSNF